MKKQTKQLLDVLDTNEFRDFAKNKISHYEQTQPRFNKINLLLVIKKALLRFNYTELYDIQEFAILRVIIKNYFRQITGEFHEFKITKSVMIFAINKLTY